MRVSEIMSRDLITITPDKRVGQALQLMQNQKIRHLPVTEKGRMVGWLTSRDLREVLLASMLEKITVADVMIKAPISVGADTEVEEAARLIKEHKIGGLPVLEGDRLVGVITMLDLIGAFLTMLSLIRNSSRLDLSLEDKPEALEAAAKIIKDAGGKILNLALGPDRGLQRAYYFRLEKCDLDPIVEALNKEGIKVLEVIP
ncbi:MAG: CBS domain-containing protein [Deltaproteobacteria bacterium]|nr:CBS domain-containing protein [Deltaproteobacteria bacterium]